MAQKTAIAKDEPRWKTVACRGTSDLSTNPSEILGGLIDGITIQHDTERGHATQ